MMGIALSVTVICFSQKKWDGGGNNNQWNNAQNWFPDGIPGLSDDVLLDHGYVSGAYVVELPPGNSVVELRSIAIMADPDSITLMIPVGNTAAPALVLSGSGDALTIGKAGIFRNASGATSGNTVALTGLLKIFNGGRYAHQTPRGNATLIDKLSAEPGTEKGIFEFDVPGLSGYTVSLTSNTFGSLKFTNAMAGGSKSYSGSGTGNLTIRGDLIIDPGVQVSSTLTADIILNGSLVTNGKLSLIPVTTGSTGRSLKFTGKNVTMTGVGLLTMNANFRVLEISAGAGLTLERDCMLTNSSNALINYGTLNAGNFIVSGSGKFAQADLANLIIGSASGIQSTGDSGNIQTATREFSKKSGYHYQGNIFQRTGTGLPDTVLLLGLINPNDVVLTQDVFCADSLLLLSGKLITSPQHLLTIGTPHIRSAVNFYDQVNSGSEMSFVSGPLAAEATDTGIIKLPTGSGNIFAPLQVKKTTTGKISFYAMYVAAPPPDTSCGPSLIRVSTKEHWIVKTNGSGFSGGLISFSYRPESLSDNPGLSAKPAVYDDNNSYWFATLGRATGDNVYGFISMDTVVSGFRLLTLGFGLPDQPLPWRITSFDAFAQGGQVVLTWRADEDNEELTYTLEKSSDGRVFKSFHTMASYGKTISQYRVYDSSPYPGRSFYRLSTVSGNRKEYSFVVPIKMGMRKPTLFPNPVHDLLNIYFPDQSSRCELTIVNIHGIVMLKTFVDSVTGRIRVANLKIGVYYVMLRHNSELITLPFIKY